MPERVMVPMFELGGPACEQPGCPGVLVQTIALKTQEAFYRCSECRQESGRMPASEKLAWAERTIARVLSGQKVD